MYRALITVGERGTEKTTEELSEQCGLSTERVDEAAEKLVHINLPDMYETIKNGEYRKTYNILCCFDFIYVLAILRAAYIWAEDMTYNLAADGTRNYDSPGNV